MSWWTTAIIGALSGIGGSAALLRFGGDFLLERQKSRWNRELEALKDSLSKEQQKYQAHLDRSIFVTRTHFDTEFLAMKEVHQRLAEVKIEFGRLFPIEERGVLRDDEWSEIVGCLRAASRNYLNKLEEWGVFLDPDLYDDFRRCWDAADHAAKIPRRGFEYDRDWAITREHFKTHYSTACQHVRDRIKNLAILPGS